MRSKLRKKKYTNIQQDDRIPKMKVNIMQKNGPCDCNRYTVLYYLIIIAAALMSEQHFNPKLGKVKLIFTALYIVR